MKTRTYFFSIFLSIFFLQTVAVSLASATIKIMPLGDSITQGISSGEPDEARQVSYRKALFDQLVAAGYDLDFVGSLNSGSAIFGDVDLADHEGHPGWRAEGGIDGGIVPNIYDWLVLNQADIVLLHIGTNDISSDNQTASEIAAEVGKILDEIERFESDFNTSIIVILARIINLITYSQLTSDFNDQLELMANTRIANGDKIIIVDMEEGADIVYLQQPDGDMYNDTHPFETGYTKMADTWFADGLSLILPVADAGPDQTVDEFDTVTLDGSSSFDPDGIIISYFWEQTGSGTSVTLSDQTAIRPTFVAPDVDPSGETLTFKLTVTDNDDSESTDTVSVKVNNPTSSDEGSGGGGGGGACFIVTAAYGLPTKPQVEVLSELRDHFLLTNFVGKTFVNLYYNYSPSVADSMAKHSWLGAVVRWSLLPLITLMGLLSVLVSARLVTVLKRRRA